MDVIYKLQKEMLRRGYSNRTIQSYCWYIKKFMLFCKKDLKDVKKADIKDYLDKNLEKGNSGSTINIQLSAIKFLFEEIMLKRLTIKIGYSRLPKTMPIFLTKEEVMNLFDVVRNDKHKLMLELIYSSGLRVSELLNLKRRDFEFDRGFGWVRRGKGRKDRPFIIAKCLEKRLKEYMEKNCGSIDSPLFIGNNGTVLSPRTVREIVKRAAKKAGIQKEIHPHSLRHSFATHIIENGYDITTLQPLLGHNSAETTMMYIHMVDPKMINVVSPYDLLKKDGKNGD